jgi:hypothetical protein
MTLKCRAYGILIVELGTNKYRVGCEEEVGMNKLELCPACGVPLIVSGNLYWENNGVIMVKASPRNRFVFFESDTIDRLLEGIEEMIGLPIEHIVLESRSREARRYIERSFPPEMCEPVRDYIRKKTAGQSIPPEMERDLLQMFKGITQSIVDIGRAYGYGDQRLDDVWESGKTFPWRTQVIRNPHSALNFIGDQLGSIEAIEGMDMQIEYEETEAGTYRVDMYPGEHPVELTERLKRKRYDFKPGEIHYERCPQCEIPLDVSGSKWDVEGGTITDLETGRRMAIFGPLGMDAVFEDLETELGMVVDHEVIEAQRRYVKSEWSGHRWNMDGPAFQRMLALRGLGNLVGFEGDADRVRIRIQNSSLHLQMVGMVQALMELVYHLDESDLKWDLADDGDLSITVTVFR